VVLDGRVVRERPLEGVEAVADGGEEDPGNACLVFDVHRHVGRRPAGVAEEEVGRGEPEFRDDRHRPKITRPVGFSCVEAVGCAGSDEHRFAGGSDRERDGPAEDHQPAQGHADTPERDPLDQSDECPDGEIAHGRGREERSSGPAASVLVPVRVVVRIHGVSVV
jgi:hypothetical protein